MKVFLHGLRWPEMKAVVQNSQLWDVSPWSGRKTQHFLTEAGQPGWTCSSTQIIFFMPSPLENTSIPQKLCPLPGTCLSQAALTPCNPPTENPLCSLLDTIPLALNHFVQLRQGESGLSLAFWLVVGCCVGWRWWFGELGLLCGHVALPWKPWESPALEAASQTTAGGIGHLETTWKLQMVEMWYVGSMWIAQ